MLASLVPLLLASPLAAGGGEVQRAIGPFEASQDAGGDSFQAIAVGDSGAAGGAVAWKRARATFRVDAPPEAGHWLLCLGGPDLDLDAELNGHALTRIADACAAHPELRAGPRFDVDAADLAVGENRLAIAFKGERGGRGFEAGPALLLSPAPSQFLRATATAGDVSVRAGNFAAIATAGQSGALLDRVAFLQDDGAYRLAAQVEFTFVEESGKETPVRRLEKRTPSALFPVISAQIEDPRFAAYSTRTSAFAPFVPNDAAASGVRAIVFSIGQTGKDDFSFRWRVRLFPAQGGALRVVRVPEDHLVVLHDGAVGIAVAGADVVGGDDAPTALDLRLESTRKAGELKPMASCTVFGAVVGVAPGSGAPIEEVARAVMKGAKTASAGMAGYAALIPNEPSEANVAAGVAARVAALGNLLNCRLRGGIPVFVPPEGPASAAAYYEDEWTLFHSPARERATLAWLLSTQAPDGAIRGDATAEGPPLLEIERDCYTVLRACRWYRWAYEGDAFREFAPKLGKALEHARARCAGGPLETLAQGHPAGVPRLSLHHLRAALADAHRELADVLTQIGKEEEAVRALAGPVDAFRKAFDAAAGAAADGDPREEAAAIALGLVDPATAPAAIERLVALAPAKDPLDWRESLLARGLLQAGRTAPGRERTAAIEAAIRALDLPLRPDVAAYHTALCFGVLGIRREDLGTLEFVPRLRDREQVRTLVSLPEGPVRIQLLSPDVQFHRQLVAQNDTALDLMLVVGVTGGLGGSKLRVVGPSRWSIYENLVPATEAWRELVR